MKKALALTLVLLLSIYLVGCTKAQINMGETSKNQGQETQNNDEDTVNSLVEAFGKKLQMVSLLAPEDVLEQSLQEYYGDYVSPALLEQWLKDPMNAPGRLTSSPWPDRIEILSTEKISEESYKVTGEIIEIANASDEIVAKRPITLLVEKIDGKWLINNAQVGEYEDENSVVYKNTQYGFTFSLPESWKDYKIITDEWEGLSLDD